MNGAALITGGGHRAGSGADGGQTKGRERGWRLSVNQLCHLGFGEMVSAERAEYRISKAGASKLARLFAVRLAPLGIGVFELRPGIIGASMTAGMRDKYDGLIAGGLVTAGRRGAAGGIGAVPAVLTATVYLRRPIAR